jgi:DNA-directed RNA polymerase subunit RPC12/RpoP
MGDYRCSKCGRGYDVTLSFGEPNETRLANCRVCPANRVFAICERCANLDEIQASPCPWCGGRGMWQTQGTVPAA